MVGPGCIFRDVNHKYSDKSKPMRIQGTDKGVIEIKDDVWIGANVTVLKDSVIGAHSVIGANSLVNKEIGEYGVYGGIPAKLIKER